MGIAFPGGTQTHPALICQADNLHFSGTYSTNSTSWTNIPGFTNTITTTKTNSKILVIVSLGALTGQGNTHALRLTRNGTAIGLASTDGNRDRYNFRVEGYNGTVNNNHCHGQTWMYVDEPAAGAGTNQQYILWCRSEAGPFYINRSGSDGNDGNVYNGRSSSSLILLEIAG